MKIIELTEKGIWEEYETYTRVLLYIKKWQEQVWDSYNTGWNGYGGVNFEIIYKNKEKSEINLTKTLHNMDDDLLFKVAVDMGVQTPNIIYAVPHIISLAATDYKDVHLVLENAFKKVYEDPSHAVALANSALETIIKRILSEISPEFNKNETLYKLAQAIVQKFNLLDRKIPEIRNLGSGLLKISQAIEDIRSKYTKECHGKLSKDYIIDDPLYSHLIINSVATVGLFLLNIYEQKYKSSKENSLEEEFSKIPLF